MLSATSYAPSKRDLLLDRLIRTRRCGSGEPLAIITIPEWVGYLQTRWQQRAALGSAPPWPCHLGIDVIDWQHPHWYDLVAEHNTFFDPDFRAAFFPILDGGPTLLGWIARNPAACMRAGANRIVLMRTRCSAMWDGPEAAPIEQEFSSVVLEAWQVGFPGGGRPIPAWRWDGDPAEMAGPDVITGKLAEKLWTYYAVENALHRDPAFRNLVTLSWKEARELYEMHAGIAAGAPLLPRDADRHLRYAELYGMGPTRMRDHYRAPRVARQTAPLRPVEDWCAEAGDVITQARKRWLGNVEHLPDARKGPAPVPEASYDHVCDEEREERRGGEAVEQGKPLAPPPSFLPPLKR